jgi:hypothetical protein
MDRLGILMCKRLENQRRQCKLYGYHVRTAVYKKMARYQRGPKILFMEPRNRFPQVGSRFLGSFKGLQIRALMNMTASVGEDGGGGWTGGGGGGGGRNIKRLSKLVVKFWETGEIKRHPQKKIFEMGGCRHNK